MSTLVIYATKHGTTEKCASMLSMNLTGEVDLHNIKKGAPADISKYDKVIIGGSIYAGRIQKEITDFCAQNANLLKDKKLGLYICCFFKNRAEMQLNSAFPKLFLDTAVVKESFGGEMRFSDMSFGEKLLTKMVSKAIAKNDPGLGVLDMKKDFSAIINANIESFAQTLNNI